jgi:peptide/histidine transporter 3/4
MISMHVCIYMYVNRSGSWTPTAELPLQQGTPSGKVEEHGGGSAAAGSATATRDGSVGWNGKPCRRDRSGGWFAGFLMLGKSTRVTVADQ